MASEGILSCEASSTRALVRLVASVDLRMALQVVLAHEALAAAVALVLTVTQMSLDM